MRIYFEHGWIDVVTPPPLLRNVSATVTVYRAGESPQLSQPISGWTWAFANEAAHFVECVREGTRPLSVGEDCIEDLQVVEDTIRQSL